MYNKKITYEKQNGSIYTSSTGRRNTSTSRAQTTTTAKQAAQTFNSHCLSIKAV